MSVFIIAEAGVNHNGSIDLAKKLIDVALLQELMLLNFKHLKQKILATKNLKKQLSKKIQIKRDLSLICLKNLNLSIEMHIELISYCKNKKIIFLSSPFDHESIELLKDLGLEIFKIPSGEITNLPYLRHIGKLNKKIILSTGMSNMMKLRML